MSTSSLPSYAKAETPSYTAHPRGDERTLGLTGRPRRPVDAPVLRGWTKKVGNVTLTLKGQPEESELPSYGRHTTIEGFVTLGSIEGLASVQIKLEGYVKCKTIAEIGRSDVRVLHTTANLWQQGNSPCPALLQFEMPLSTTYCWGEEETGPLPPTFEYTYYDVQGGTPGLRARVKYTLSVEVELAHRSLKDRLSSSLSTPIVYLPRSRPGRPPSNSPTTVFESIMEHRVGGKSKELDPIVWKLRLPPPGTYAIKQPIPFRVSVTSRSSSLIAPFAPSRKDKASIRVYVLRQVIIKVNTIDLWRSFVIAEGRITHMPQAIDGSLWLKNVPSSPTYEKAPSVSSGQSVGSDSEREGWASQDWTGVLNIDHTSVTVGGFQVGGMVVKDFIVLSVVPPNPRLGSLLEVKRVVPIQLTTDGWDEVCQAPPTNPVEERLPGNGESNGYLDGDESRNVEGPHQNGINGMMYHNGNG